MSQFPIKGVLLAVLAVVAVACLPPSSNRPAPGTPMPTASTSAQPIWSSSSK